LVYACDCDLTMICQAYTRANAVFTGTLIHVAWNEKESVQIADYIVDTVYKGSPGNHQTVKFGKCSGSLMTFAVNEKYLVFDDPADVKNICSRTNTIKNSISELEYLNGLSRSSPIYTIGGRINGLAAAEAEDAHIVIAFERNKYTVPLTNGEFSFTAKKKGDYKVSIYLPFKAKFITDIMGTGYEGEGDIIDYSLEFKPNECDYRTFEIQQLVPSRNKVRS
jgi:hypothetical protein